MHQHMLSHAPSMPSHLYNLEAGLCAHTYMMADGPVRVLVGKLGPIRKSMRAMLKEQTDQGLDGGAISGR